MTRFRTMILSTAAVAIASFPVGAQAAGDLYIYTWGEYTPPALVEKFEQQYDVDVHIDTYDSNETMLAKLKAGAAGYDVIVPGDYMVAILIKEDLLAKVEPNKMSNFDNIEERWRDVYWDPGRQYTVPWAWGTTSFVVDTDVIKGDPNTLAQLFDPEDAAKGSINMLRDVNDVINASLRYLNLPRCNANPDDMKKVLDLLMKQKQWVKSYNSETKELLVSGEALVSMSWNGYAMRARDEKPSLVYAYPKEGYTGWMDNLAVPKTAPNMENAKLFMNFMMEPENAAMVSNYARYSNGIKGSKAFMDKDLADAPEISPPESAPDPEFVPPCDPEVVQLYDRVWTKLLR
ncbi:extracellular solute-binding protein [Afifella aestuarii]|uniref:extracellular solute-binding protein n=1 Tax=Afifella aestuarii TaxID=1909496 RepID=UPI001FECE575|nr:extracellular solute-binding protein [Afifella aestuarii]